MLANYLVAYDIYIILNDINMKKKLIRLTESDLYRMIRESIRRIFDKSTYITYDLSNTLSDALYKIEKESPDWDDSFDKANDDFDVYCLYDYKKNGNKTFTVDVIYEESDYGMSDFQVSEEDKQRLKGFINDFKTDNQEYKNMLIDIIDNIEDYMNYEDVEYEVRDDIERRCEEAEEYYTGYDKYRNEP